MTSLGPLIAADEQLIHQITDTFGTVGQSERSWTEKVWASVSAGDGSLQADFGLGLYPNRGVMDGFAGVSRDVEQWTVRASRELGTDDSTSIGPLHYEILDPLNAIRIRLESQDVVPVSFDCTLTGVVPAFLEDRELKRSADGRRIDSDIVRFHQTGTASGWIEVDGVRTVIDESWISGRDRSWGVRYMIGAPARDLPRVSRSRDGGSLAIWTPILCTRADGSRYAIHVYYHSEVSPERAHTEFQGGIEHPDGGKDHFASLRPELRFDPVNRRLVGGVLHAVDSDGTSERPLTITALGGTGFHLGAGRYFSFDGKWHGQWEGPLNVEGEYIADCTELEASKRLHQIRDCIVRLEDPVGGGVGIGTIQTMVYGAHPATNLTAEGSFL
jgi:hypothetical protein